MSDFANIVEVQTASSDGFVRLENLSNHVQIKAFSIAGQEHLATRPPQYIPRGEAKTLRLAPGTYDFFAVAGSMLSADRDTTFTGQVALTANDTTVIEYRDREVDPTEILVQ